MLAHYHRLLKAVEDRTAKIAVFGQGYVGLPLAVLFSLANFETVGVDVNPDIVKSLNKGASSIAMNDLVEANLRSLVHSKKYSATTNGVKAAKMADIFLVCVPTPLDEEGRPNLNYIRDTVDTISKGLEVGKLIIVESTTYPGSIEKVVSPLVEEAGFEISVDIGLAHCPERVDQRNKVWSLHNTSRVIGAIDEGSLKVAKALYQTIITAPLVEVKNIRTAEAAKELENAFRLLNISFVNEFAMYCEKLGLDAREVIEAAATKPFGFLPHYPGPGVGGHCLPKDAVYLLESGRNVGVEMRLIAAALEVNRAMIDHVVSLVRTGFEAASRSKNDGSVLVVGLSYKENIDDVRQSPGIEITKRLICDGFKVKVFEPHLTEEELRELGFEYATTLNPDDLKGIACLCIVQYHSTIKKRLHNIAREEKIPIIIDCKNLLPEQAYENKVVLRLGSSLPRQLQ